MRKTAIGGRSESKLSQVAFDEMLIENHGRPRPSLEEDVAGAAAVMEALAGAGISIDDITARLVDDGVQLFAEAADHLYAAVQKKRRTILDGKLNAISCKLPKELDEAVKTALEDWARRARSGTCGPAMPRCGPKPTRRSGSAG